MAKIITPNHNFPLEHVAISASQNVYGSQKRVDEIEANSVIYYKKNNSMVSLKFKRTADSILDGFDENKALFPVYKDVPLFAITTIAAVEHGMLVSVVGSKDVGKFVKKLQDYYKSIDRKGAAMRLKWVPECDGIEFNENDKQTIVDNRKKLTLNNSMSRLAGSLNLGEDDAFIFAAGDILFYDYMRVAYDRDSIDHSLIMDFNGLEIINPPIPRNYYHRLITRKGEVVHFKEPNVWTLGSEFNLGLSDETYNNRLKGGFGVKAFLGMIGKNMLKNPHKISFMDIWTIFGGVSKETSHYCLKKLGIDYIPKYYEEDLESLTKFLNMSPVRVKTEHDDYLRLKDVDAMHDYVFVRRLVERYLADVFPEHVAHSIVDFAEYLKGSGIRDEVSTLAEFPDRINDKVDRVQFRLKKKRFDYKLERPFNNNGEFIAEPNADESLEKAVERSVRDLERYSERKYS
ncbi:hypothetical protein GOV06_05325 [Candidatus Woesearchaeota archaeon]|nr:hypothetical protein [Candidatus Woesearchaeota archaeon]